jgi:hypothetical protein
MIRLFGIWVMRIALTAVLLTSTQSVVAAKREPYVLLFSPSTSVLARRVVTQRFDLVYELERVDPAVLRLFFKKVPRSSVATGYQRFEATDQVDGINPARTRRFNFAGHNSDVWFILYEVGGTRAAHSTLQFFQKTPDGWRRGPTAVGILEQNNFPSLIKAIKKGWFTVDRDDLNI